MADSPFYQPARQNFSSSQSMQQPQGGFGGYQMPQQNFGGGQAFGGFGGGQGFNFGGGQAFGGFQQPQFSPFQGGSGGGFGGGFSPFQGGFGGGFQQPQFNPFQGGFGGGFNPMFGGIGGLGFNPMMGPQFGMPMQGFNPYQQQMQQFQQPKNFDSLEQPQQTFPSMDMMYRGGPQMSDMMYRGGPEMSPEMRQRREQDMRNMERMAQQPQAPVDSGINKGVDKMSVGPEFNSRQPMYGGIGGLGFNPMMGPQFGMPMQGMGGYGGFNPYHPPQQREQLLQDQKRFGYGQDQPQMPAESAADINLERERREWSVRNAGLYTMTPLQRALAQG